MAHKISIQSIYKSFDDLKTIKLPETFPDFVVLTGENGSGKSHFLEALNGGNLTSDAGKPNEIQLFDWNTVIPNDSNANLTNARAQFLQKMDQYRSSISGCRERVCSILGIPYEISNSNLYYTFEAEEKKNSKKLASSYDRIINECKYLNEQILRGLTNNNFARELNFITQSNPIYFLHNRPEDIFYYLNTEIQTESGFSQDFARIFLAYRDARDQHYLRVGRSVDPTTDLASIKKDEFEIEFGPPPWEFVNSILSSSGLDFQIDHPSDDSPLLNYSPQLTKLSKGAKIYFKDLSSGEKVLMSFALAIYNAQSRTQRAAPVKVILLDEVDAPLHPEMVEFLLKTIQKVLVDQLKLKVILATHKPTTVALAPKDSLYLMDPKGPSVKKTTQKTALDILTVGIPTMSISFDDRRQVFTEGKQDAEIYSILYQKLRGLNNTLNSQVSLAFIQIGQEKWEVDGNGDAVKKENGGGCSAVQHQVQQLRSNGVNSIHGVIDWDKKNRSCDGIHVLGIGSRYSIENVILDPVCLTLAMSQFYHEEAKRTGFLTDKYDIATLPNIDETEWQTVVDQVISELGFNPSDPTITCEYRTGLKVKIPDNFLQMNGHKLQHQIEEKAPFFKGQTFKNIGLMKGIAERVLPTHHQFIPLDLIKTFQTLTA